MVPSPPTLQTTWLLPHIAAHLFSPLNLFLRLVTRGLALRAELEWDWKRTLGTPILSNLFDTMRNTLIPNLWPTNWIYRTFSNGMFWLQNLTTDLVGDLGWVPGIEPAGTKKQPEGPLGRLMLRKVCQTFPKTTVKSIPRNANNRKALLAGRDQQKHSPERISSLMFIIFHYIVGVQWSRSHVSIRAAWPTTRFASAPAKVQGWWCQSLSNWKFTVDGSSKSSNPFSWKQVKQNRSNYWSASIHRSDLRWHFSLSSLCCFASSEPTAFLQTLLHGPELFIQWDPTWRAWKTDEIKLTNIYLKPPSACKLKDLKESRLTMLNSLEALHSTIPYWEGSNSISNSWAPRWPFRLSCRISCNAWDSLVAILRQSLALLESSNTSLMLTKGMNSPDTLHPLTIGRWLSGRHF